MGQPARKDELAPIDQGQLQVSGLLMEQLGNLEADGFENVTAEDLTLPILSILQDISPQCKKTDKENYDSNVEQGQYYNPVTKAGSDTLTVIPVGFDKSYIEWAPRASGGGFIGRHDAHSSRISDSQKVGNKLLTPEGNELVETREHYLLVFPEDGAAPYVAMMPFKSTGMKASKRFINEMTTKVVAMPDGSSKRVPMFAQKYRLEKANIESNTHGSWYGLGNLTFLGYANDQEFAMAKQHNDAFATTAAKASQGLASLPSTKLDSAGSVDVVTDLMK